MSAQTLPQDERPLRIREMAEWLGVSDKTIRRMISFGELKSFKLRGLRMVRRRDFMDYLQQLQGERTAHA